MIELRGINDPLRSLPVYALEKAQAALQGLCCIACRAQGAEMAKACSRDEDCDAGFYGIDCDAVAGALAAIEEALKPMSCAPCLGAQAGLSGDTAAREGGERVERVLPPEGR